MKILTGLVISALLVFFSLCANAQNGATKEIDSKFLFEKLKEHEFKYNTIKARFDVTITTKKSKFAAKGFLRIKKDSIIWVSLSAGMGIEVARLSLTPDTIKLLNRWESTYFINHFKFINKIVDAEVDYDMLQAFITGNDFSYYEFDKFNTGIDKEGHYEMNTIGRRKLKKTLNDSLQPTLLIEEISLDSANFKIIRHHIKDVKGNKQFDVDYTEFLSENGQLAPKNMLVTIKAKENIQIEITFTKYELDIPLEFPFTVPDKFQSTN